MKLINHERVVMGQCLILKMGGAAYVCLVSVLGTGWWSKGWIQNVMTWLISNFSLRNKDSINQTRHQLSQLLETIWKQWSLGCQFSWHSRLATWRKLYSVYLQIHILDTLKIDFSFSQSQLPQQRAVGVVVQINLKTHDCLSLFEIVEKYINPVFSK